MKDKAWIRVDKRGRAVSEQLALRILAMQHPPSLIESPPPLLPIVLVSRGALQVAHNLLEAGRKAVNQLLFLLVQGQLWFLTGRLEQDREDLGGLQTGEHVS